MNQQIRGYRLTLGLMVLATMVLSAPVGAQDKPKVDAATKQLMAANGLFQRGLYDLAVQEYADFIKQYPKHQLITDARYALAICHYRQGDHAKTTPLIEAVLKDKAFDKRDEALAVVGHAYMAQGKLPQALKAMDEVLAKHGDSAHAEASLLNRAQVLYLKGNHAESIKTTQQFLGKYPKSDQAAVAKYLKALAQKASGKADDAIKTAKDLLAKHPSAPQRVEASLLLGQVYESQGRLDEAAAQYRAFLKAAAPENKGDGHYSLGVVLYRMGKHDAALKELDTVLKRFSKSRYAGAALMQKGLTLLAANKVDTARGVFQQIAKSDKQRNRLARYWLAQCDLVQNKFAEARKQLDVLAKEAPKASNMADIKFSQALCSQALNEFATAATQFKQFTKTYPKDRRTPEANYRHAFSLHRDGKHAESLEACRTIGDPGQFARQITELSAENLFLLKNYAEAEKAFAELAKRGTPSHVLRYGQSAYFQGNYQQTVERLTDLATKGKPDSEPTRVAVFLVGDANLQLGNHDEAVVALEHYLSLAKGNQDEAKLKLAVARLRSGDQANAEKALAALAGGPAENTWVQRALLEYGQLLHKRGDHKKASDYLAKLANAKAPETLRAPAQYLLGWSTWRQRKFEAAAAHFDKVIKQFPKHALAADAMFQRGACLQDAGKYEQASNQLNQYLQAHKKGKHADAARYRMAVCLSRRKMYEPAIKALQLIAKDAKQVNPTLLYELAWAQRGAKKNADAMKSYRQLLAKFGNNRLAPAARNELAELLYLDGKFADAVKLLEQVVTGKGTGARVRTVAAYRLAWSHLKLEQHDKAAKAFADFAATKKDDKLIPSALYQAGEAFARLDKHAEAKKYYQQLLEKYPKHQLAPVAQLKQGEVLAAAGDYENSYAAYKAYLDQNPKGKYRYLAQFGIGWSLESRKKPGEARKWYAKVVEGHNGPTAARAQFQIGETYFTEKQYHRAARELLKVDIVYGYPQWSARALYEAGRSFEQVGETQQAKRQYQQCISKFKDEPVAKLAQKALAALTRTP